MCGAVLVVDVCDQHVAVRKQAAVLWKESVQWPSGLVSALVVVR